MKIVTQEEMKEFDRVTYRGGLKGLGIGLGLSIPASLYAQRYYPRYRKWPVSLKSGAIIMVTSAAVVIAAERAGIQFDKQRYSGSLVGVEKEKERREAELESAKPVNERALEWVNKNKYSVVVGSWAASMAGAWAVVSRDKYMTFSQKIVQVRMWAQGVTIAMIIGTAILSQADRQKNKENRPVDHSWMEQLAQSPEEVKVQQKVSSS